MLSKKPKMFAPPVKPTAPLRPDFATGKNRPKPQDDRPKRAKANPRESAAAGEPSTAGARVGEQSLGARLGRLEAALAQRETATEAPAIANAMEC